MDAGVTYVISAILAYLVGGFPTGVVLTKRKFKIDVREIGSGNIGATNVTRVFGWYAGSLTLLIDVLKGFLPLYFLGQIFPDRPWLLTVTGISLVVGHCYSPYLKFQGGKGVATSLGCLITVSPWAALVAAVTYGVTLGVTRISAVGSLVGMSAVIVYIVVMKPPTPEMVLVLSIAGIVLVRHSNNIKRLLGGKGPASPSPQSEVPK